jgi:predicted MFS family arabinose efflux permease
MDHVSYLIDRQHRFLLIAAGIIGALGIFVAGYCYPPIDMETSVPLAMLLIVFVPLVLARVTIKREEFRLRPDHFRV